MGNPYQMNRSKRLLTTLTAGLLALSAIGLAFGDDDERGEHGERGEHRGRGGQDSWIGSAPVADPVAQATYRQECGACHMPYQPGLLPAQDWAQIMTTTGLVDHYGDDASLTEDLRSQITAYLAANAADQGRWMRGRAVRAAPGENPAGALPRITRTAYFVRKHDEIPARLVTGNPQVGSFSQCNNCHRGAAQGNYDEHQIDIPGHGRWED